ncbi:unnamed protein product [Linum tenue]|uniref:Stress response protein NST1-like n=1 Tax=Linum tenue TaxID=586396 RepID=A0AAV0KCG5_9ROSI|nr:unnamed protein product [Linum tenue]
MKRKKWSELEEQTLLTKYNDLLASGSLSKLKTREKKFRPIADHVNAVHHLHDPAAFPFKWSWRDVSIKVQNMRHQYLGVKQKIRISSDEFNWKDGENHWENFLKYKEVFGDVELEVKGKKFLSDSCSSDLFRDCGDLGLGIDSEDLEDDEEEEEEEEDGELKEGDSCDDDDDDQNLKQGNPGDDCNGAGGVGEDQDVEFVRGEKVTNCGHGGDRKGKLKGVSKRLGLLGAQVVDLRDVVVRREEKRREREFDHENGAFECEERRREEKEEKLEKWEMELEERELGWGRKEFERRLRVERDLEEKRRQMRAMEEKREEEEMEWRERVLRLQIEHEKTIMQVHAEACHNQMQILGVMARLVCQFYGSAADGLGGGLGGLPSQVLQNLQHPGGLGDNGKPDSSSPSEFL